jgi:hypothetical protein
VQEQPPPRKKLEQGIADDMIKASEWQGRTPTGSTTQNEG